jgi:two-component system cell cycle response regulator
MPADSGERYTVALQGFSEFERGALASFFRLAAQRSPTYVQVDQLDRCDFVIADTDHRASLQAEMAEGREKDTVFVGAKAPPGAMAWLQRPIDPMHIVRELDSLVEQRQTAPAALAFDFESPDQGPQTGLSTFGTFEIHEDMSPDVLVAEDSAIARRFLQVRLQRLGYRVHLANDGDEAMQLIARQQFLLVFLDVVLGPPGSLDGLKICQYLKHDPRFAGGRGPKVVIVTGLAGATDRVRATLAGCDAYLTKPLLEPDFIQTLQALDPQLASRPHAAPT